MRKHHRSFLRGPTGIRGDGGPGGYHLDPAPLTELIEEHHGDLESISYICEHFYWPAFCWRKASELNPDIREEICGRFVEDYAEEHVVDEEDVERSAYECLLGIPLFVH